MLIACYILTLDRAVNQKCTCVNKRKKKRKQVDVMKEYRLMPAAIESVGDRKGTVRTSLETENALWVMWHRLINPSQDAEVLSGFLKITQRAMVKRRSWVNIAVCPSIHPSLTHHRNINPFENKEWKTYFCKCVIFGSVFVRSLKFVNNVWLRFHLYMYEGI